jgi:transaldolase
MKPTQQLHDLGQSLWIDNITRGMLTSGTLARYIRDLSVTGLTSNPTIFEKAIKDSHFYDEAIQRKSAAGVSAESLFFDLALEDLTQAADLFLPIHRATQGVDGYVSLEVSPLLAYDTANTIRAAVELHGRAKRPNLYIKIPGTREGLPAIEESIFAGVPVNVTLLFSAEHYQAAAEAYMRGIERRLKAGKDAKIESVASVFISRWDGAANAKVPPNMSNRLGIAIARRTYRVYRELWASARGQAIIKAGGRPQRLLLASTGTKDPKASDTLYIEALAAPDTVNTMPEGTLLAFADHGKVGTVMPGDGGDAEAVIAQFKAAGIDDASLASDLQRDGAKAFEKSWNDLMSVLTTKGTALKRAEAGGGRR